MYRYCRHKVHPRCGCRSARARKWPAIRVNWPCDGGHWPVRRVPARLEAPGARKARPDDRLRRSIQYSAACHM